MKAWKRTVTHLIWDATFCSLIVVTPALAQQITLADLRAAKQKYLQEFLQCSDMSQKIRDGLETPVGSKWDRDYPSEWYVAADMIRALGCSRNSNDVHARLRAALDFIKTQPPVSRNDNNWWHKEIGVPRALAEALLVGSASLPSDLREQVEYALNTFIEEQKIDEKEGANVVWAAWARLAAGFYFENVSYAQAAYELMSTATNQGQHNHITEDWGYFFHLHILNMHYGGQHFGNFAEYLKFSDGTGFSLASRALPNDPRNRTGADVCLEWLKNFLQWIYYKDGLADPYTVAKFPHWQSTYGGRIQSGSAQLGQTSSGREEPYRTIIKNIATGSAQPLGARAFPSSRYLVTRRNNFFASLIMVNLAEPQMEASTFAPIFGAVNIVDPSSYKKWEDENILKHPQLLLNAMTAPVAYEEDTHQADTPQRRNPEGHSDIQHKHEINNMLKNWGYYGVSTLDGYYGMGAEQLTGEGNEFSFRRSWFFLEDEIVCIGSGITTNNSSLGGIRTFLHSFAGSGSLQSSAGRRAAPTTANEEVNLGNLSWLQHDGMGYFFPRATSVHAQSLGAMSRVYLDHGDNPSDESFAAVLLPTFNQSQTENYAARPNVEVLQCDRAAHIIHDKKSNITGVAAFEPLSTNTLTTNLSGYVLYQNRNGAFHLSLYNPFLEEGLAQQLGAEKENPMFDAGITNGHETYHSYRLEVPFRLRQGTGEGMGLFAIHEISNERTEVQCYLRVYRKFEMSGTMNADGSVTINKAWVGWNDAESGATTAMLAPNANPVAVPGGPYVARVGETITFNGNRSFDRDGGEIVDYQWRFGDGATATGESVSHRYNAVGVYEASLTVKDDEGVSSQENLLVTLQPQPSSGENIRVVVSGDDKYELYINGARMGEDAAWTTAEQYTAPLVSGKNVIALKAENWDQAGALLAEVFAQEQSWPSNATWKVSLAEESGWQQIDFNDSRWRAATSQGVHGVALPWAQFQNVTGISANQAVHWIWSTDKWQDHIVYLRFTVPLRTDTHAPLIPSGFRIEAQK